MRHRHWKNKHNSSRARQNEEIREGIIQHHGRFAFLIAEKDGDEDVFLHGRNLGIAMDGDRVSAVVRREHDGRYAGEILKIITHARTSVVGVLHKFPHGWAVLPEKSNSSLTKVKGFAKNITPKDNVLAVLEITAWPSINKNAEGIVTEILGDQDDLNSRITSLLRIRGIKETFPKEVLFAAAALPVKLEPENWQGREEVLHAPVVTIDGKDAKDFDDAVSIENLGSGNVRLGVHIADVAHYVHPGSVIDKEAYNRATSVYLPDRVVPMLPESLSNNLCSLVPHQERLTVSVFMDINSEGKVIKRRMVETVIKSCRRFTYEEVQDLLDGKAVHSVTEKTAESIKEMGVLAKKLFNRRVNRGALDFDLPEYKVEVDAHGKPLRVMLRPRLDSHRLIEEFMLLANESIAVELIAAKMPFLHRRHDEPDPKKINETAKTLGTLGFSAGHLIGSTNTHKAIQDILREVQGHALEPIVNSLIVRSMQQAIYSPESKGHFGIAAKAYAHFTSPIRRYPDLTAHRAIKALLKNRKENHDPAYLTRAGAHCSERERTSAEAEYKAIDIMRAELFKDKIGEVMEGIVTNVIESGSFVMCGDTGAEGMLRNANLKPGTKVQVKIDAVNTRDGKIDLSLMGEQMPAHWRIRNKSGHKRNK